MNFSDLHIVFVHIDPPMQGSVHPCGKEHEVPGFNEAAQVASIKKTIKMIVLF
jgi:hypothetical protein